MRIKHQLFSNWYWHCTFCEWIERDVPHSTFDDDQHFSFYSVWFIHIDQSEWVIEANGSNQ